MTSPAPTVTLVSECFIKPLGDDLSPESKQPLHFTPFELSFLNFNYSQKGLLFAKPENQNNNFSISVFLGDLKTSLSTTLTHFYPLAARLASRIQQDKDPLNSYVIYIDPNNSPGVKFIHAKTDATISDVLNPIEVPTIVRSFFDLNNAISHDGHTLPLLSVQVTELADGIFIGGSVNHVIADATSFWHFMNSWNEIFKSGAISRYPVFEKRSSDPICILPYAYRDQFIERYEPPQLLLKERFFHFTCASVARLKKRANAECNGTQKISSLQAVSALLWRCITRVRRLPEDSETECVLAVCNRRRINPPLSDGYFGSPVVTIKGTTKVKELLMAANGLGYAALKLNEAITNQDDAAVQKWVESWFGNPVVYKLSARLSPLTNVVVISGSPRFDMYGCEFGLGKAIAARSGFANKANGRMAMYPGREGGGSIDVEVCLTAETMKDLQHDPEFISACF
uniref:uncharacterized acetyltransferase At3g50280-like n=1 Tax=Erigeron canadensis TaxID=72917 RepID=UPI001CB98558|nr:uncharacterized acetyltransferase At3g50280-like [Erigeron canadensis]